MAFDKEGPSRFLASKQLNIVLGSGPARPGNVGVWASECENAACPDHCPAVAMIVVQPGQVANFVFTPEAARELAFDLLATADRQNPAGATARRGS